MPAADPCDAETILVSIVHGSTYLGIAVGFAYEETHDDVVIRGEGVPGPSCVGEVSANLVCTADFLVPPPITPTSQTAASLVITTKQADTGTKTHTLANMLPRGFAVEMNRDAPPLRYRQRFIHKGNLTSSPVSYG